MHAGTVDIEDMFGVEHDVPYLLNVSDDPLLTGHGRGERQASASPPFRECREA